MRKIFVLLSLFFSATALAVPPSTTGDFSLYVSTSGSDSASCLSSAHACKSAQAASTRIPKNVGNKVTVNVAAGTYYAPSTGLPNTSAALNLAGFHLGPNGNITFAGPAETQVVAPLTASAVVATAGAADTVLTLALPGPPASNSYQGMFAVITAGSGAGATLYPIVSNDSTHITIINYSFATLDTTTTVKIVKPAAILLPSSSSTPTTTAVRSVVQVSDVSPAGTLVGLPPVFSHIIFKDLEFDDVASDSAFFAELVDINGAAVEFDNCIMRVSSLTGTQIVSINSNSNVSFNNVSIVGSSASVFGVRAYNSSVTPTATFVSSTLPALLCSQHSNCLSSYSNYQTSGSAAAVTTLDSFVTNGPSIINSVSDYISGGTLALSAVDDSRVSVNGSNFAAGNIWLYDGAIMDFTSSTSIAGSVSLDKGTTPESKANVEGAPGKRFSNTTFLSAVYED